MDFKKMGDTLARGVGTPMHVESPDGFPLYAFEGPDGWEMGTDETKGDPVLLMMVGQDSSQFRRRKAEAFRAMQASKRSKKSFDDAELEALETIAAGVVGWERVVWQDADGKPCLFEYTHDNLIEFLRRYPPGRDQADTFIVDRSNFFRSA